MSMNENLRELLDELIQEIENELEEATTTGNVAGYQTPNAFGSGRDKDKKKQKKNIDVTGYTKVKDIDESVNENLITERQFKGLEGIDDKTPLTKISDAQKLKIIQGTGNNISFKVPKGFDRNFWQVFSKGKIKKKKSLSGDIVYFLPGKFIDSPNFKSEKDLINGVDWDAVERIRRFNESVVNEAKIKRPVNRWLELKNDETMHPHKKMAMGLKELKYQLRETEKFFNWYNKIKTMNELDSNQYWKRTNKHIYSIKEKLINIAKTIQEIEK